MDKRHVGEGSARAVYKYSRHKVIKMSKNQAGIMQNKIEAKLPPSKLTAKVFGHHPNFEWIIMEYAPVLTKEEFESYSGFPQDIFMAYLDHYCFTVLANDKDMVETINQEALKKVDFQIMNQNPFIKSIIEFVKSNNLSIRELSKFNAWGRTRSGRIVLIDYGLNWDVYRTCYTVLDKEYSYYENSSLKHIYKKGCVIPNEDFEIIKSKSR